MSLRNILEFERIVEATNTEVIIKLGCEADPLKILFNCVEDIKNGSFAKFETGGIFIPGPYHFESIPNYKTEQILANFVSEREPLWCRINGPQNTVIFTYNENLSQHEPKLVISNQLLDNPQAFTKYVRPFLPVNHDDYCKPLLEGIQQFQRYQKWQRP
jgi:hypothetical protein